MITSFWTIVALPCLYCVNNQHYSFILVDKHTEKCIFKWVKIACHNAVMLLNIGILHTGVVVLPSIIHMKLFFTFVTALKWWIWPMKLFARFNMLCTLYTYSRIFFDICKYSTSFWTFFTLVCKLVCVCIFFTQLFLLN